MIINFPGHQQFHGGFEEPFLHTTPDVLIADLTGDNPNALYMLGFAEAIRIKTIIIMNKKSKTPIPFSLEG